MAGQPPPIMGISAARATIKGISGGKDSLANHGRQFLMLVRQMKFSCPNGDDSFFPL